ncbi:hypothetical protein EI94DRAFT_1156087 [Lactarius quietus]|nr:hypothetical protein EI94DRAFT_1156087 [Lactarius quietus]
MTMVQTHKALRHTGVFSTLNYDRPLAHVLCLALFWQLSWLAEILSIRHGQHVAAEQLRNSRWRYALLLSKNTKRSIKSQG